MVYTVPAAVYTCHCSHIAQGKTMKHLAAIQTAFAALGTFQRTFGLMLTTKLKKKSNRFVMV